MTAALLNQGSYLAIFVLLVLTGLGLPIPEEVIIVAAGAMASHGHLQVWPALAACLSGILVGDMLLYGIGRTFGDNLIRAHPYWARFITLEREEQIKRQVRAHGVKILFLARFLIGLRTAVYLTAGILRIPFLRFFCVDAVCATIVAGMFFALTYHFGRIVTQWVRQAEILVTLVVGLVVVGVVLYVAHRFWKNKRNGAPPIDAGQSAGSDAAGGQESHVAGHDRAE